MAILNRYDTFEFPRYQFREYPKFIPVENGKGVTVKNKFQEERYLESLKNSPEEAKKLAAGYNADIEKDRKAGTGSNDLEALKKRAEELGIVIGRGSTAATLRKKISDVELQLAAEEEAERLEREAWEASQA